MTLANGSTEKRYRVGTEINLSEPLTVIERILSACNGRLVESGGIYKVYTGAIPAAVVSITDDDIVISQGVSGDMFPGRESVYNSVTGSYCEPENGGQMKAFKRRTNADQLAADNGQIRAIEMTLDYCRSNTQAQRVARFAVNDNLRLVKHVIPLPAWARKLEPRDVIDWNSTRLGYVNKKFIAGDVTLCNDGIVWLAIREANPNDSDSASRSAIPARCCGRSSRSMSGESLQESCSPACISPPKTRWCATCKALRASPS
ncbi:hypothetical protein JJB09_25405 [Rhizobium sp. KVB221]|uniref:Uncharacterized protein n=1 Tax=Rhizobium setariae TaxID=2801340 RepID=A0A936YWQ9_9HYPH|nr:phage tail protein [Rhizobium setariae]MBL0375357.1 hypothetical protein [Rhizobium setariae]